MSEGEIREQLRAWILARAKDKPARLPDDLPLLEKGVLSSLDVVELIVYIERLRGGSEVPAESLEPAAFRDINSMYRAFFAAA